MQKLKRLFKDGIKPFHFVGETGCWPWMFIQIIL